MGTHHHKHNAPKSVRAAVLTASTTRQLANDDSGNWLTGRLKKEGHRVVAHHVVADDADAIVELLQRVVMESDAQVVIINGGTGITAGDVTIEAVRPLFEKELTAFGALFAMLSYDQIGSAAILSRAGAGVVFGRAVVFCMPGSLKACKLAYNALISDELGHLAGHLQEGRVPHMKAAPDGVLLA